MKTCTVLLIALLTVASVFAAEKKDTAAQPNVVDPNVIKAKLSGKPATAGMPAMIAPDFVLVTIGKDKITQKDLDEKLKPALAKMVSQIPPQFLQEYTAKIRKDILMQLVVDRLLVAEIKKKKIKISDEEIENEVNKQLATQKLSLEDFKELLKAYGTTYEEQQEQVKKNLSFIKLMDKELEGKEKIPTADEAREFYDENIEKFKSPAQTRTSHILISTKSDDPNSDPNKVKAGALVKAQGLLKQVKGGADFAELARENSICPSAKDGGDLKFMPKGSLVPEYESAAAALEIGQISDIVETQFGYHIIKLTGVQDANTVQLEEVESDILSHLADVQKGGLIQDYIEGLLDKAKIKYTNPEDKVELPTREPAPEAKPAEAKSEKKEAPK